MVARYIIEKYEKHRYEAGRKDERQAWQAWHRRQQDAFRAGRSFDEPPPGYSPDGNENGQDNQ